jgi:putative endonuclease
VKEQTTSVGIGNKGENFVVDLLQTNGWQVIATQWKCRWGEIDIIAYDRNWLIFVEVKTRSDRNWDQNGALAISMRKQQKLYKTASEFLSHHPNLESLSCRFDVALVRCAKESLDLEGYLEAAFTLNHS